MSSLGSALGLYRLCTKVDAVGEAHLFIGDVAVGAVVAVGESGQREDVAARDAKDRQLGQSLVVRVGRHGASQTLERRADGVNARPLARVRLDPALFGHVLVVLARTAGAPAGAAPRLGDGRRRRRGRRRLSLIHI